MQKTGHKVDFDRPAIVDTESRRHRCILSEMINIHHHEDTMDGITDKNLQGNEIDFVNKIVCETNTIIRRS